MKTTLDLADDLLARAKAQAALERTSLTRLIEEGLTLRLRKPVSPRRAALPPLPVFAGGGGMRLGIDPCSNRSMLDACDDSARDADA